MNETWMKLGWLVSAMAAVLWILPFGIYWFLKGEVVAGSAALALSCLAIIANLKAAPWRFPQTRFWKLLAVPYSLFLLSVLLLVYQLTQFEDLARIQYGLWLIPCFVPFFTLGYRTWNSLSRPME